MENIMGAKKGGSNKPNQSESNKGKSEINKAKRAEKQKDIIEIAKLLKEERLHLTAQCCEKYKCGIAKLKKRFGTLNIRRLRDILDDSFYGKRWYIIREKTIELRIAAKKALKNVQSKESTKNLQKDESIHQRPNSGDGKTQVD